MARALPVEDVTSKRMYIFLVYSQYVDYIYRNIAVAMSFSE